MLTATDTLRAALLADGRLLVFRDGPRVFTNGWGAAEVDSTESWIVARRPDGAVFTCRESGGEVVSGYTGLSGVAQVSGGGGHFLALRGDGGVSAWRKNASTGVPEQFGNPLCHAAETSDWTVVSVSAGTGADCLVSVTASGA